MRKRSIGLTPVAVLITVFLCYGAGAIGAWELDPSRWNHNQRSFIGFLTLCFVVMVVMLAIIIDIKLKDIEETTKRIEEIREESERRNKYFRDNTLPISYWRSIYYVSDHKEKE